MEANNQAKDKTDELHDLKHQYALRCVELGQLENYIEQLEGAANELKKCLEYFIERVNNGTIKSKTTYAIFVNALSKYNEQRRKTE